MAVFTYRPIDLDRPAIRLVRLLQGNDTDEIQCELFDGWINQLEGGIPYDALSYTWGGTEKAAKITVNGSIMHVTSNLFEALQHLRFKEIDRILWVDAICIDQDNNLERTHQVQQMSLIYKEAEQVVIWLGRGTKQTDLVMDSIKRVHKNNVKVEGDWRLSAQLWMHDRGIIQPSQEDMQTLREGMVLILNRPWFSRIWILQEIANARVATVVCGKKSVSARTFAQYPSLIELRPQSHCQAVLDIMPGLSRKESWWNDKRDLHTLLLKFRGSLATDERDIIYALLGMSSDACNSDILHPDYTKPIQQVIREATSLLLPQISQNMSFYNFIDWTLLEFLQSLDSLGSAILGIASKNGEEEVVKLLLATDGVKIDWKDSNGLKPLHWGAQNEHEALEELLLAYGAELKTENPMRWTPLSIAASSGHNAIVQLMLEKGAKLEAEDHRGMTPTWSMVLGDHRAVLQLLLKKYPNFEMKEKVYGQTLLYLVVQQDNEAIVLLLLEKGAKRNAKGNFSKPTLLEAALSGNGGVVKLLVPNNTKLKTRDYDGWKLVLAARDGNKAAVRLLLKSDAEPETNDATRQTLLSWVIMLQNETVVQLLLENGAELEAKDRDGRTLLSWAVAGGSEATILWLLEKGAELETKDRDRRTPLSWAVESGNEANILRLLENGAELDTKDFAGWNPLSLAAKSGNQAIVKLLINKGAALETKGFHGWTPLSYAAMGGNTAIVQLLVRSGAELRTKDIDGRTPLLLAVNCGQWDVVKLLRRRGPDIGM